MSVPWNSENAAHLLRRTGFAATPKEVKKAFKKGLAGTVQALFTKDKNSDKSGAKADNINQLQLWWMQRMAGTSAPLREKLTLFWHNHFATGYSKVEHVGLMFEQNRALRKHCLGSMRDMVLAMSRDPAMIIWLDNRTNTKGNPNENYARELMELFTTGVLDQHGNANYTESDVAEAARAFTGWTIDWNHGTYEFHFSEWNHDFEDKTFRGQTGPFDGGDIVDMLVIDPATARRVAMKLWSFFAYEVALDDPVLDGPAQAYLNADTSIRAVLEHMFLRDEFFSDAAKNARVKCPVEFAVGAARLLGGKFKNEEWSQLAEAVKGLGQELFDPPSVFGWDEGLPWVGAQGMLSRAQLAEDMTSARGKKAWFHYKPARLLGSKKQYSKSDAGQAVDAVLARLGPLELDSVARAALVAYMLADEDGQPVAEFQLNGDTVDQKVRGLLAVAMALPEFQLH